MCTPTVHAQGVHRMVRGEGDICPEGEFKGGYRDGLCGEGDAMVSEKGIR